VHTEAGGATNRPRTSGLPSALLPATSLSGSSHLWGAADSGTAPYSAIPSARRFVGMPTNLGLLWVCSTRKLVERPSRHETGRWPDADGTLL